MAAPPPYTPEKPFSARGLHISTLPDDEADTSPHTPLLPRTPTSAGCCHHHQNHRTPRRHWPWLLHAVLLTTSLLVLLASYLSPHLPTTAACVSLTSSYSPARPAVRYQAVHFDANISTSPYVGPTKTVDLQWGQVNFGDQMVSAAEMSLLHKPLDSLTVTDPRTGEVGYRIGLEVFHQLHCLNMIRKATYADYQDEYAHGDFGEPRAELRGHLDHCIEMLRMNLMCHADVGVITFHEVEGKGLWPDFSSWHVCRDYEAVRSWAVDRVVATDVV